MERDAETYAIAQKAMGNDLCKIVAQLEKQMKKYKKPAIRAHYAAYIAAIREVA